MKQLTLGLIKLYQRTISPVTPHSCCFQPTCSQYACDAVVKYGLVKGIWLILKRLVRCNPLSAGGYDPVP